jgi:hypothetical protein
MHMHCARLLRYLQQSAASELLRSGLLRAPASDVLPLMWRVCIKIKGA